MTATETPTLPYDAKVFRYGPGEGIERLTKVYPSGMGGELLTPEEIAVWDYAKWLEAENVKLRAELEAAIAPTEGKKGGRR